MGVIINGGLNINNTGTTINKKSSTSISINQYSRINQNGSININTDYKFFYSTNLTSYVIYNPDSGPVGRSINSVLINGGPPYVIINGVTFPILDDNSTILYAHHFGGTSITVSESGNATMLIYLNGTLVVGSCINPITGTYTWNYPFTENDKIFISADFCGT
jgi:hypothetical protein